MKPIYVLMPHHLSSNFIMTSKRFWSALQGSFTDKLFTRMRLNMGHVMTARDDSFSFYAIQPHEEHYLGGLSILDIAQV